jgi:hypothetical protein
MTFGSVFGRTFSPTFQPSSQAAVAGGGWWDLSGTITSCVAAYQPKGAASYAASLVDLSGNGNNAAEGTSPSWASETGWDFSGDAQLLVPYTGNIGAVIVFAKAAGAGGGDYGNYFNLNHAYTALIQINSNYVGNSINYDWDGTLLSNYFGGNIKVDHTVGMNLVAGTRVDTYFNGTDVGNIAKTAAINSDGLVIGNRYAAPSRYFGGYIYAIAFYSTGLTDTQMGNLHTAIAAL